MDSQKQAIKVPSPCPGPFFKWGTFSMNQSNSIELQKHLTSSNMLIFSLAGGESAHGRRGRHRMRASQDACSVWV